MYGRYVKACCLFLCMLALGGACAPENQKAALLNAEPSEDNSTDGFPFTYVRGQATFEAYVNGHGPYNFIIDTGGNPSLLDLETARESEVPLDMDRFGEAEGVGGERIKIYPTEIVNLRIGDQEFGDFQSVAMDLSRISERLGVELHGILGVNFLEGRVTVYDYVNQHLSFPEPDPGADYAANPSSDDVYTVPLTFQKDGTIPLIPGVVISGVELTATLDTGSNIPLELFPWAIEKLGMEDEFASAERGEAVGARGAAETRKLTLERLSLGPIELNDLNISARTEARRQGSEDGNIGTPMLKDFRLTLDYAAGRIVFEKLR